MARRYTINNRSSMEVGLFTGFTTTGLYILELPNNQVEVFTESEITEIKPFTFSVRAQNGGLNTFCFEDPSKRVDVDDVLISRDGTIYTVTSIDTGAHRPKTFIGRRLMTSEI